MNRNRPIGILGPSYVGKTTFVRYLVAHGPFRALPIWSTRPRRPNEVTEETMFTQEEALQQRAAVGPWIVQRVGDNLYGVDIELCQRLLESHHALITVAPSAHGVYQEALPEMFTVLMWPSDFKELQSELLAAPERTLHERQTRIAMNRDLSRNQPTTDLLLTVPRCHDEARRTQLFAELQHRLWSALS